jgi:hypothetical protein
MFRRCCATWLHDSHLKTTQLPLLSCSTLLLQIVCTLRSRHLFTLASVQAAALAKVCQHKKRSGDPSRLHNEQALEAAGCYGGAAPRHAAVKGRTGNNCEQEAPNMPRTYCSCKQVS